MENIYHNIQLYLLRVRAAEDMDEVIRLSSLFINRPVCVIDLALRLVGYYPRRSYGDEDWDFLIDTGRLNEKFAAKVLLSKKQADILDPYDSFYSPATDTELEKYRCSLFIGGRNMGGMMIMADGSPFTHDDGDYIELMRMTAAEHLLSYYSHSRAFDSSNLFRLAEDAAPEAVQAVERQLAGNGASGNGSYAAACCSFEDEAEIFAPFLNYLLASLFAGMLSVSKHGSNYYLLPLGEMSINEAAEKLRPGLETLKGCFALSDAFESLSMFPRCLASARSVCTYAAENSLPGPLHTVAELRSELLTRRLSRPEENEQLCHPDVLLLRQHDREYGTQYCRILYGYLCCFHNLSKASELLYLHRNTLSYHLNNIRALISVDPEAPEAALQLLLSLCLQQ